MVPIPVSHDAWNPRLERIINMKTPEYFLVEAIEVDVVIKTFYLHLEGEKVNAKQESLVE